MTHFEHGAIDKHTSHLVDPVSALKRIWYKCPDCEKDVYVRKGPVKIAHFAHRSDKNNPCTYYNRNPSREQKHKNAQLKLKQFLERGKEIDIGRICACGCGYVSNWGITCTNGNIVKCEHRFVFNNSTKIADVAVMNIDKEVWCIFEVVHTHYTKEPDRPEPWHEIMADEINSIPSSSDRVVLTCVRQKLRPECIARQKVNHENWLKQQEELRKQREKEEEEFKIRQEEMNRILEAQRIEYMKEQEKIRIEQKKKEEELQTIREKHRKEKEEREKKRLEEERLMELKRKELYKKFAIQIPKCYRCQNLITGWLKTDNHIGRCEKCMKQINELIKKSSNDNKPQNQNTVLT